MIYQVGFFCKKPTQQLPENLQMQMTWKSWHVLCT